MNWMLAAILICGAAVFTSCKSDDDKDPVIENLGEKIIGKWMFAERNGEPTPTNKKRVFTFVSPTKAYVSASHTAESSAGTQWIAHQEANVVISGNKMTLTMHPDEHTTLVEEYDVTDINNNEFTANCKITRTVDGEVVASNGIIVRYEKITADYSEAILGLWVCTGITGGETYNDANARLEFLADGTYRYYRQEEGGQWKAVHSREYEVYFVDGTLLATRWKEQGEAEQREWWEIASINGDDMVWTALRQNDDGTTFQQEVRWKRVDFNLAENIIGKWMTADIDGQPALTNDKSVVSFVSPTKAIVSLSRTDFKGSVVKWVDHLEYDVEISGNKVTIAGHPADNFTLVQEYTVTAIDDAQMLANVKIIIIRNGEAMVITEKYARFEKVTVDYSEEILGKWEGHITSEQGSEYDDGEDHQWEYKADGNFVYYVQDEEGNWIANPGQTLSEYFVDGTLLCTRWVTDGTEYREWWEIESIKGGVMKWKALRKRDDGTTYTATFAMIQVKED